jgi:hypothetical protein
VLGETNLEYCPALPSGKWRTREAEAQWRAILESREAITNLYHQQLYLAMTDARFASRMANRDYRARVEREHKAKCDQNEAAAISHLKANYVPDTGDWEPDFELQWILDGGPA